MKLTSFQAGGTVTEKYYSKLDSLKWVFFYRKEGDSMTGLRFVGQDWYSTKELPIVGAKLSNTISGVRKYAINSYANATDFIRLAGKGKETVQAGSTIGVVINSSAGYLFGFQTLDPNEDGYDPFGQSLILYSWNDYLLNGGVLANTILKVCHAVSRLRKETTWQAYVF